MDWATISALATAFGTLVLALATFASVRSANMAARTAERALAFNLRPLLFQSRLHDPPQKITWIDRRVHRLDGGHGVAEVTDDVVYLALGLRNAGAGMAVLQAWRPSTDFENMRQDSPAPLDSFRRQTRDLYIPPDDVGFWQGAIREQSDELFAPLAKTITAREPFLVEILYVNTEGGQRTVSRFLFLPTENDGWLCTVGRHFSLDHDLPR
ncbi:MAG: hypothetical protein ACREN2_11150 [Candidatus Dormibacteria bacterium]